jgi:L,D-peptidoglycan transpeptidase YkuD (ErfK/YbiS/YcfS/YnhG family)
MTSSAPPAPVRTTHSHAPAPTLSTQPRTERPVSAPHPVVLPLGYSTGTATQVITVVAGAESDTRATVQAWARSSIGWRRVGPAIAGWLGTDGMSPHPSEQLSAVPMGSYTLTQAFGHDSNPGTALPYRHTTPADWWISQPGPLYNTLQHCSSNCPFTQGDPNEHLYYETPYYNYAVVIDYNRDPVRQGAGSAFFLHVTIGAPTQGCVSIPQERLVALLRWLRPADHPRILIGVSGG